tara:strand:- start:79 stop:291 length:213 start_codon:yes stop_codon:yes gene_type:complete
MQKKYTKFVSAKSFSNKSKAETYMEKVKKGYSDREYFIKEVGKSKDDDKKFRVGFVSRQGNKKKSNEGLI